MVLTCSACGQKNRLSPAKAAAAVRCGKCRTSLTPIAVPLDADRDLFDEIVRDATVPVLVDFWAAWCGPCRMAAPEVKRVASETAGRALVLKVDTEAHPDVAARFGVQGIPNFVILKGGRVVFQQAGLASSADMKRWLEEAARA